MGNQESSSARRRAPGLLERSQRGYGTIADSTTGSVNQHRPSRSEFQSDTRRRIALTAILICQLFDWVAFATVTMWIPQTLELNVFFFNSQAKTDTDGYYAYMDRLVITYYTSSRLTTKSQF